MHPSCHPFFTEKQSRKEIAADPSRYPIYPFIKTHSMDDWEKSTTTSKALDTYSRHMAEAMYFVSHDIASLFEACRATIPPAMPSSSQEYATFEKKRQEQQMYWKNRCTVFLLQRRPGNRREARTGPRLGGIALSFRPNGSLGIALRL